MGYSGDGKSGCVDIDECTTNNGGCDEFALCTNTPGSFVCGPCLPGFVDDPTNGCTCSVDFSDILTPPQRTKPTTLINIAAGMSYTLSPAPNYPLTTDADDTLQLTDGLLATGGFFLWSDTPAVGWTERIPVITLDLGEVKPIRGVSYSTAAGTSSVSWPHEIFILAAGEDAIFHEVGRLVTLSEQNHLAPDDGYAVHEFWTDALETHGRYVALVVSGLPFIFADEVEVFEGDAAWLSNPYSGQPISDPTAFAKSRTLEIGVARRMRNDTNALGKKIRESALTSIQRDTLACAVASSAAAFAADPSAPAPDFQMVLPLNRHHEDLLAVQGRFWAMQGRPAMFLTQGSAWDALDLLADPQPANFNLSLRMMNREYRALAFQILNASETREQVSLRINGLPGGVNPGFVTVHEVAWTDTAQGVAVAAALPEAPRDGSGDFVIDVPRGVPRQVWLTVHPEGLAPGTHTGTLEIFSNVPGFDSQTIPLTLEIASVDFPVTPTLHLGGWDYVNHIGVNGITTENRELLIEHLRERFVDTPWATNLVVPKGQHDGTGAITSPPSTVALDAWMNGLWLGAPRYGIYVNARDTFLTFAEGTAEFTTAVIDWAEFWADHMRINGVDPQNVLLLLVDEPRNAADDATIFAWASAINQSTSGFTIWEDVLHTQSSDADPAMIAEVDILCPPRHDFLRGNQAHRDYFVTQQQQGKGFEFYSPNGPARLLDPYAHYRMQAWSAWEYDATAIYFWSYSDNAGVSSWREITAMPRTSYTPLFLDATSVTAGKQMEAIREGVQDYEYFVMLRDAIDAAESAGHNPTEIAQMRATLESTNQAVTLSSFGSRPHSYFWDEVIDREAADVARGQLLDLLEAL